MYDHDFGFSRDDFMGRIRVPLESIAIAPGGRLLSQEYELDDTAKGTITLSFRWRNLGR